MKKLIDGESFDVAFSDVDDINYYYNVHTLIILGNSKTVCDLTIDGLDIKLSTGFVYNYTPINKITLVSTPAGLLIIGKKTRDSLFNSLVFDETVNNYVQSSYVPNYFE